MKRIDTLIINDFLDFDSIYNVEIDFLDLNLYQIEKMNSKILLHVFKGILKNENTIYNSSDLIKKIINDSYLKSMRIIVVPNNKKIDLNLEEIISHSIEKTIDYLVMCKREGVLTDLKVNEKELLKQDDRILICKYVDEIKQSRFLEAEHIILKKLAYSIEYASKYIKKPWKELEERLKLSSSKMAFYNYIKLVLIPYFKEKFPNKHVRSLIQKNYPEYEKKILDLNYTNNEDYAISLYAKNIIGGRWIEFEMILEEKVKKNAWFTDSEIMDCIDYMINIYPGRWKSIESFFINNRSYNIKSILVHNYIEKKVITEYQENIKTFEDLEKYKNDIQMWDSILGKAIKIVAIPLYNIIKERNLINYNDREERKKLFLEYFPQSFQNDFIFTSLLNF